jgi:hypothetical protein
MFVIATIVYVIFLWQIMIALILPQIDTVTYLWKLCQGLFKFFRLIAQIYFSIYALPQGLDPWEYSVLTW